MSIWKRIVAKPRTFAAREWIFQIHLWAGLVFAIYAIVIGVTGSVLVLAPEMRDAQVSELLTVAGSGTRVPVERVLESVRAYNPAAKIGSLGLPYTEQSTFRASIQMDGKRSTVFVHPFTAEVIGEREPKKDILNWFDDLHIYLLTGNTGKIVNGFGGLSMVLLCLTGIVVWWPGKAHWIRAVSIKWNARWKRVNYDIHSAVGFYSLIFALMFSASGAYFVWPDETKRLISLFSTVRPTGGPNISVHENVPEKPLSELLRIASNAVPGSWLEYVSFPSKPGRPLRVALMSGAPRLYPSTSNVDLDPVTGEIVQLRLATQRTMGEGFLVWLNALHFGNFGVAVKILWVLLGLTPAILGVSGALMWWNRVLVKKISKRRERRIMAAASPEQVSEGVLQ